MTLPSWLKLFSREKHLTHICWTRNKTAKKVSVIVCEKWVLIGELYHWVHSVLHWLLSGRSDLWTHVSPLVFSRLPLWFWICVQICGSQSLKLLSKFSVCLFLLTKSKSCSHGVCFLKRVLSFLCLAACRALHGPCCFRPFELCFLQPLFNISLYFQGSHNSPLLSLLSVSMPCLLMCHSTSSFSQPAGMHHRLLMNICLTANSNLHFLVLWALRLSLTYWSIFVNQQPFIIWTVMGVDFCTI